MATQGFDTVTSVQQGGWLLNVTMSNYNSGSPAVCTFETGSLVTSYISGTFIGYITSSTSSSLASGLYMSPLSQSALWGNQITAAYVGRQLSLYRYINGVGSFYGSNGCNRRPNGSQYNLFPWDKNPSNVNYINFPESALNQATPPLNPYESCEKDSHIYSKITDDGFWNGINYQWMTTTGSHNDYHTQYSPNNPSGTTWTGIMQLSNNFPYLSGYPLDTTSSIDPPDTSNGGRKMYFPTWHSPLKWRYAAPDLGVTGSFASTRPACVGVTSGTETQYGFVGSYNSAFGAYPYIPYTIKITTQLSDEIDLIDKYNSALTDLLNTPFDCSASVFTSSNSGSLSDKYHTYIAQAQGIVPAYTASIYNDALYTSSYSSYLQVADVAASIGWRYVSGGGQGATFFIEKGEARLIPSPQPGVYYTSTYFVAEFIGSYVNQDVTKDWGTWTGSLKLLPGGGGYAFDSNQYRSYYDDSTGNEGYTGSYLGKYHNYTMKIVSQGSIRSDQVIGYDSECDIRVPFPSVYSAVSPYPDSFVNNGLPQDDPLPIFAYKPSGTTKNVPIVFHWYLVVIGKDPTQWASGLKMGMNIKQLGS